MKTPYPAEINYEDTSGRADTSSSGSLQSMLRNFQFPNPPVTNPAYTEVSPKSDIRQLPRNNSWARELPSPIIGSSKGIQLLRSSMTDDGTRVASPKPSHKRDLTERPPLRELSSTSSRSNRRIVAMYEEPKIADTTSGLDRIAGKESTVDQTDLWVDVAEDQRLPDEFRKSGPFDKENAFDHSIPMVTRKGRTLGASSESTEQVSKSRPGKQKKQAAVPEGGFTIHVDDHDEIDHPQPLRAHPRETPTPIPGSLAPANANTSRQSSIARVPWYRQKSRVGGNGPNYRSSIYGPGALARKVQQEVMITVNIELDVLRREMNVKFAEQKTWFQHEIKESQVWAVRVEEENRKLREELAKERKRREGAPGAGGGVRGLC
ncbi:MAG: hypothetical protein Q9222_006959 [Ikaeria aurantiellina]